MKVTKKRILSFCILFAVFCLPIILSPHANAGLVDSQEGLKEIGSTAFGETDNRPTDIRIIIVEIIQIIFSLLGGIFLIMLVMAGYRWMVSSGNDDEVYKAKEQLKSAIIGLIIVLMSWSITYFVLANIRNAVVRDHAPLPYN